MKNILDLEIRDLESVMDLLGAERFRAGQIFGWLAKGVTRFDDMGNVPKDLREALSEEYYIGLPDVIDMQESAVDGTRKCLFEFADGMRVESVFMRYGYGNSVCISSQVGCRMGCRFCASTVNGLERDLTGGEMLAQVLAMKNAVNNDMAGSLTGIGHVVVMGMGEPFDNYDNLSNFISLINDPAGYGLGMRNITVSTCGIVPVIDRFGTDFPQVNLAISLHAPNDDLRKSIMPIANKYSIAELIDACREYSKSTGRRITYEYSMISGVNDFDACAKELAMLLSGKLAHVNLIPLNDVRGNDLSGSSRERAVAFQKILERAGIAATIRRTLGADIDAACGQLKAGH